MNTAKDIFDEIEEEDDVFSEVDQETVSIQNIKNEISKALDQIDSRERKKEKREIINEVKQYLKAEISKIQPKQNIIEKTIEKRVIEPRYIEPKVIETPPPPPQIIREVRVEVEKKDPKKYVEESKFLDLLVKISKLESQLKEARRMAESPIIMPGGSGVIGIPPPEPSQVGYVLTINDKKKAEWKVASGGTSSDQYTTSNVTTTRTLDPTTSTIDDLYNVVASLIVSLQGAGIIQ